MLVERPSASAILDPSSPEDPTGCAGCCNRTDNAGSVKAARMKAAASYGAQPPGNLVANDNRSCDRIEIFICTLGGGKRRGDHGAARMHHRFCKRVIKITRMRQAAVNQRSNRGRCRGAGDQYARAGTAIGIRPGGEAAARRMVGGRGDEPQGVKKTQTRASVLNGRNIGRRDLARPVCQGLEWGHCKTHHTLPISARTSASDIGRGSAAIM